MLSKYTKEAGLKIKKPFAENNQLNARLQEKGMPGILQRYIQLKFL